MNRQIFGVLSNTNFASRKRRITDSDFIDRVNYYLTPLLLAALAILVCTKAYVVGEPLQCWVPMEFSSAWEKYAENYCWVQNTYYVKPHIPLPKEKLQRDSYKIGYYQWVPFILMIQAVCFLLPSILWQSLNTDSGIRIKTLVQAATDASNQGVEEREKKVQSLARHILLSLGHDLKSKINCLQYNRKGLIAKQGWWVCALYIGVKLLYIINILGQFVLLQSFLGTKYNFYGIEILRDLVQGRDWMETSHFPRVTMCDFEVRALGQPRTYSLQCVLVINLFNEKIFIFLWFWFAFVGILTLISLITWLVWFILPQWRRSGVQKCLPKDDDNAMSTASYGDREQNETEFMNDVLRPDGQFLMKMIGVNVGEPIMYDIVNAMWQELQPQKPEEKASPIEEKEKEGIDENKSDALKDESV